LEFIFIDLTVGISLPNFLGIIMLIKVKNCCRIRCWYRSSSAVPDSS